MIHVTRQCLALILVLLNGVVNTNEVLECPHDSVYMAKNNSHSDNWRRNQEIYISPYELNHKQKDFIIIDVRPKQLFDNYHINGSFNLPRDVLISKSIFKQKSIVLVGKGNDYKLLERLQEKLIKNGFKQIHILDGGMNFWKSKIKSKKLSVVEYHLVNFDYLLSGDSTNWKIIHTTKNINLTSQFSNMISINSETILNPASLSKSLLASKGLIGNILLVLDESHDKQKIQHLWQSSLKSNIYIIDADKMLLATNEMLKKRKMFTQKKRTDGARITCLK